MINDALVATHVVWRKQTTKHNVESFCAALTLRPNLTKFFGASCCVSVSATDTVGLCYRNCRSLLSILSVSATDTVGLCYWYCRSLLPILSVSATDTVGLCYRYCRSLLLLLSVSATDTVGLCYRYCRSLLPVLSVSATDTVGLCYRYCRSLLPILWLVRATNAEHFSPLSDGVSRYKRMSLLLRECNMVQPLCC
jgi:hypothetical protein